MGWHGLWHRHFHSPHLSIAKYSRLLKSEENIMIPSKIHRSKRIFIIYIMWSGWASVLVASLYCTVSASSLDGPSVWQEHTSKETKQYDAARDNLQEHMMRYKWSEEVWYLLDPNASSSYYLIEKINRAAFASPRCGRRSCPPLFLGRTGAGRAANHRNKGGSTVVNVLKEQSHRAKGTGGKNISEPQMLFHLFQ